MSRIFKLVVGIIWFISVSKESFAAPWSCDKNDLNEKVEYLIENWDILIPTGTILKVNMPHKAEIRYAGSSGGPVADDLQNADLTISCLNQGNNDTCTNTYYWKTSPVWDHTHQSANQIQLGISREGWTRSICDVQLKWKSDQCECNITIDSGVRGGAERFRPTWATYKKGGAFFLGLMGTAGGASEDVMVSCSGSLKSSKGNELCDAKQSIVSGAFGAVQACRKHMFPIRGISSKLAALRPNVVCSD